MSSSEWLEFQMTWPFELDPPSGQLKERQPKQVDDSKGPKIDKLNFYLRPWASRANETLRRAGAEGILSVAHEIQKIENDLEEIA